MVVYFISGLGADERAFRYIRLAGVEKRFIRWLPPETNESLMQYATRLQDQIDTNQPVILVGLSFGGIVAQEIAGIIECERLILISSVKHPKELSYFMRAVRRSGVYRCLPVRWMKPVVLRWAPYWFDAGADRYQQLLTQVIDDTDDEFAQWAIRSMMRWKGQSFPAPTTHIHGTHDRIFPPRYIEEFIPVEGGGHFMVVTHARVVSKLLQSTLETVLL